MFLSIGIIGILIIILIVVVICAVFFGRGRF